MTVFPKSASSSSDSAGLHGVEVPAGGDTEEAFGFGDDAEEALKKAEASFHAAKSLKTVVPAAKRAREPANQYATSAKKKARPVPVPEAPVDDESSPEEVFDRPKISKCVPKLEAKFSLMDPRFDEVGKKSKKSKKGKKSKKQSKKRKVSSGSDSGESRQKRTKGDKKKRKRSSSSSSSSSSISSAVFRGVSTDPHGKGWHSMVARHRKCPGRLATAMMQRMANEVGRDGIVEDWDRRTCPAVGQAYYNRVWASEGIGGIPPTQKRDRREAETLCVVMDLLATGKFRGLVALLF